MTEPTVTSPSRLWRGAIRIAALLLILGLVFPPLATLDAKEPKRGRLGPMITVDGRPLELALDEVELDWSRDAGARFRSPALGAQEIPGARLAARDAVRAVFFLSHVADRAGLHALAGSLQGANPGADVHLVLYEPGLPESAATRSVVTREVSLILAPGEDPAGVLAGHGAASVRAVQGVPGGFVVETTDAFAALDLADALGKHPRVKDAAPLIKRLYVPR